MKDMDPQGFYEALGVQPSATAKEIKSAFWRLAQQTHQDTSGAKSASTFHQVSKAYDVLNDPVRRVEYDGLQYQKTVPEPQPQYEVINPISCSRCGSVTPQPRYVAFSRVYSFLFWTTCSPSEGIFCASCARREGLKSSFITMLAGWWAAPWGIPYSVVSIVRNGFGGKRDRKLDEEMLWHNAVAFLTRGNFLLSYALAVPSKTARDKGIVECAAILIERLEEKGIGRYRPHLKDPWRLSVGTVSTHLFMAFSVPGIIVAFFVMDSMSQRASSESYSLPQTALLERAPSVVTPYVPNCTIPVQNGKILGGRLWTSEVGHELEIYNGSKADAIIKLRDAVSGVLVSAFFVARGQTAQLSGIPDGQYKVQYAFGTQLALGCQGFADTIGAGEMPSAKFLVTDISGTQPATTKLVYRIAKTPATGDREISPLTISPEEFSRP